MMIGKVVLLLIAALVFVAAMIVVGMIIKDFIEWR